LSAPLIASTFAFITVQPGAEALAKADIAARRPELRPAFSRPGFLTFKADGEPLTPEMGSPTLFARAFGVCLGAVSVEAGEEPVQAVLSRLKALEPGGDAVLHVYRRDGECLGEEASGEGPWTGDRVLARAFAGAPWPVNLAPAEGQLVLEAIEVDPGRFWIGAHRHGAEHRATPGARPPRWSAPPEAPSRVWYKLEEALWWSGATIGPRDVVLDLGCAPGGGSWAMLRRGARVVGVDPAEVAPEVLGEPGFEHRAIGFEAVDPASVAPETTWVVFDINLSPMLTLKHLRRLLTGLTGVHSAFVTLKMNRPQHLGKVPWMLEQLQRAGFTELRVTQLFYNRREIFVYARRPGRLPAPEPPRPPRVIPPQRPRRG